MKVFISWSGNTSLKVAQIFREWLPSVIQSIEPYVSSEDIDKGARWSTDIAKELEDSTFGILCVTRDNLEAPWLSFEAGALSKTMEKTFVTPFLFDIKRAEVKGPILQFQSTIFEKNDIEKMIKTLNRACGDASISDTRLEKSFEVWYPTLESELNKLKIEGDLTNDKSEDENPAHSSEMLEEILELSRDNQKLLKTPDDKLYYKIESISEYIQQMSKRNDMINNRRKINRKYSAEILEEILHRNENRGSYGFLMTLGIINDDLPWIYDMGKELINILKSQANYEDKTIAIREFRDMVDFTFGHPLMREIFAYNKGNSILIKELPYMLMRYLDEFSEKYLMER